MLASQCVPMVVSSKMISELGNEIHDLLLNTYLNILI